MYITGKYILGGLGDLTEVKNIRSTALNESEDEDCEAIFALAFEEGEDFKKPVSTGRLLFLGEEFRIDQVVTLDEYRNKGYGDFVVRMLIDKAFTMGAKEIFVDSDLSLTEFFGKIGFRKVGDAFILNGREKIRMVVEPHTCTRLCSSIKQ